MKIIDDRIKYLLKEKSIVIEEYLSEGSEGRILSASINMRISMELKFLAEILNELPKTNKITDKDIDDYFPFSKPINLKEQYQTIQKRNAVKSFIKNKL